MVKKEVSIFKIILVFIAVLYSFNTNAQFSYAGVSLGYYNLRLDKGIETLENTSVNELHSNLSFFNRPLQNLGFGVELSIPIIKGFTWNYNEAATTGGSYFEEENKEFGGSDLFEPNRYEYNIKKNFSFTIKSRFFTDTEVTNLFLGLRYTILSLDESFIFSRSNAPSSNVPNQSINYLKTHRGKGVGFEIGYMPHLGDHFFLEYNFIMDFLTFDLKNPFSYNVEYSQRGNGQFETITYQSKMKESRIAYQFNIGVGYFF